MTHRYLLSLLVIMLSVTVTQAQSTIEDYLRLEENQFILYAPNEVELEKGKEKLVYAAKKFSSYFGHHSTKMSVLLTENPSNIQNLDLSYLRSESNHFLPFFTESSMDNQTQKATNVFAINMGAILMERNNSIEVAAVVNSANNLDLDLQSSDVITSINGYKVSTLQEFKKHYSAINVTERITLELIRDGLGREVTFHKHLGDKLPTLQKVQTSQKQSSTSGSLAKTHRPLTHEACHGYFISAVDQQFPNITEENSGYGSEAMPDWLDEAAATLCEGANFHAERKQFLLQNLEDRYSLGELFTMRHPLEALTKANRKTNPGTQVLRLEAGENIMSQLGMFYSQVQSIANFLVYKTQPTIMWEITVHYAQNKGDMSTFLKDQVDLPNTMEALEREWLAWVKKID